MNELKCPMSIVVYILVTRGLACYIRPEAKENLQEEKKVRKAPRVLSRQEIIILKTLFFSSKVTPHLSLGEAFCAKAQTSFHEGG